jgi:hypothetical protein
MKGLPMFRPLAGQVFPPGSSIAHLVRGWFRHVGRREARWGCPDNTKEGGWIQREKPDLLPMTVRVKGLMGQARKASLLLSTSSDTIACQKWFRFVGNDIQQAASSPSSRSNPASRDEKQYMFPGSFAHFC